jgi:hypothetical protein
VGGGVQLGPLVTAATNRPIVPTTGDSDDGEIGGIIIGKGNRGTRRKPAPVLLCPPQTPQAARTRTRAAAVGSQRLTAELRHSHALQTTYQCDTHSTTFQQRPTSLIDAFTLVVIPAISFSSSASQTNWRPPKSHPVANLACLSPYIYLFAVGITPPVHNVLPFN